MYVGIFFVDRNYSHFSIILMRRIGEGTTKKNIGNFTIRKLRRATMHICTKAVVTAVMDTIELPPIPFRNRWFPMFVSAWVQRVACSGSHYTVGKMSWRRIRITPIGAVLSSTNTGCINWTCQLRFVASCGQTVKR